MGKHTLEYWNELHNFADDNNFSEAGDTVDEARSLYSVLTEQTNHFRYLKMVEKSHDPSIFKPGKISFNVIISK